MILFVNLNFSNTLKLEYFFYKDRKIEYLFNKSIYKNNLCKIFIKSAENKMNFFNSFEKCIEQKKINNADVFALVISKIHKGQEEDIVNKFIIHIQQKHKLLDKKIDVFSNSNFFKLYNKNQKKITESKKNHIKKRRELASAKKKETDTNKLRIINENIKELRHKQIVPREKINPLNSIIIIKQNKSFCDFL